MLKQFYRPFIMEPVCKTYRTSSWRRANTRNVSILTPYGCQFTFSTQLLTLNYLLKLLRQEPLSAENFFDVYKEQLHGFAYVGFVRLNRSIKRPDKALFWKPEAKILEMEIIRGSTKPVLIAKLKYQRKRSVTIE